MLTLFTKPIESVTATDVRGVIGWPESSTVEFKGALPDRDGRSPWLVGGDFTSHTRDKIFKEVVALANGQGGHLLVGVDEDGGRPACASAITPIPRVTDLASRLERSASSTIDPPIPNLLVWGIATEADGGGVLMFRVPGLSNRFQP